MLIFFSFAVKSSEQIATLRIEVTEKQITAAQSVKAAQDANTRVQKVRLFLYVCMCVRLLLVVWHVCACVRLFLFVWRVCLCSGVCVRVWLLANGLRQITAAGVCVLSKAFSIAFVTVDFVLNVFLFFVFFFDSTVGEGAERAERGAAVFASPRRARCH